MWLQTWADRRRTLPGSPQGPHLAFLDELVELAVGRAEVDVAVTVVLGRLVDLDARGSQPGDPGLAVGAQEPDRARRLPHLARAGDREERAVGQAEHVGTHPARGRRREPEHVSDERGHL